jgi:MoxR-like ATPase
MTNHSLHSWSQYLKQDDYDYLIQYIENVKNNIPNDKMIILSGKGGNGKTTLIEDIRKYLGEEFFKGVSIMCSYESFINDIIYCENIKQKLVSLNDEISCLTERGYRYNKVKAVINFIKYNQSMITMTNQIEKVNEKILEYSRVITMEHVFI